MPAVDPVILQLKADVADYQRDLTRAQRLSEDKLARIERAGFATGVTIRKGFDLAKGAALGFASAISVDLLVGAIKSGLDYASSLGEVATQLGVTTNALQEYRYAGSQAGLANEEVDQALSQLTRRIGEAAAGTKEQSKAFETLGISLRDSKGEILDAGRAIPLIAEAMKDIESPAERAALLMDLFGRSGQKLEPLLEGGASAVNNLRDAAHDLGIVLSEDQIQNADDAADKLDQVKQVLQARLAGVVADNAKEIIALADALANLADKAIKAAAAWFDTKRILGERDQMVSRANAYLDGRKDLTAGQRADAKQQAARIIEKRQGIAPINDDGGTGLFTLKRVSGRNNPTSRLTGNLSSAFGSDLNQSLSGPAGNGTANIAALLGVNPVPVVAAATELANGLAALEADIAVARAELTGDLRQQAQARKQQIDAELGETIARIDDEEGVSAAVKGQRKALETQLASLEKQAVDARLAEDAAREAADLADRQKDARQANVRLELDALSAEADVAETRAERLAIERRILELRQETERAALEEAISADKVADATAARAALANRQGSERSGLDRDFEGPLARYARDGRDTKSLVEEAAARRIADLNDTIANTMAKKLGIKDPFLKDLLNIFLQQNIFGPLAQALSGAQGGGGGGIFGSIVAGIGAIFGGGRASGGRVNGGSLYRVNEGASPGRVEGFIPQGSGEIIPLGRMNALRGGGGQTGGIVRVIVEEGPNFMSTIRTEASGVAVEVVRGAAPSLIQASVNETRRQVGRPKL